jgi:hypothetical protein
MIPMRAHRLKSDLAAPCSSALIAAGPVTYRGHGWSPAGVSVWSGRREHPRRQFRQCRSPQISHAIMAIMAKGTRLRLVDTNPIWLPSRFWAADRIGVRASDGDRFAKCATVVTELYSAHLEAGPPLPAKTSWARFVPTNERGPRRFSGIAMTQDLGLGEVHEVPYEPQILCLPDDQRRSAVL